MARGLIARAWLGGGRVAAPLGRFTLRADQREAIERVRAAFDEFGGALVVDPPGSGKTVVALGVARGFADTLVVAPATLHAQWTRTAEKAGVPVRFATMEGLSRGRSPPAPALLVVDEAHHARTPGTARYRALTRLATSARVLLLTATPVVNRASDRDALLALFLGARAGRLEAPDLARCLLRQRSGAPSAPSVMRLPTLTAGAALRGIAEALRSLPPPLPLADGGDATALIRMSLALAWSSSLAAIDRALARRVQRGEALRDLIAAGRVPSRAAIRHWIVGDDGTQLAFAEIVAPRTDARGSDDTARRDPRTDITVLDLHLRAVSDLRALVRPHVAGDAKARAAAIQTIADSHPDRRIVVFARHAATIGALHSALRELPGVVAITGTRVHAAAGRWTRDEVLAAMAARTKHGGSRDPRAIRILLATDLLAEGVELTGAGIIIHADLPWTPARLAQRRGRVARPGGRAREVFETWIAAPAAARELVRLGRRLRRKRRAARIATRGATAHARLAARMRRWAKLPDGARIAAVDAPQSGFIAAVRHASDMSLIGGHLDTVSGRWRVTPALGEVLRLCDRARGVERAADGDGVKAAVRRIARCLSLQRARLLLGGSTLRSGDGVARVAQRLERILGRTPPTGRSRIATLIQRLLSVSGGAPARSIAASATEIMRVPLDDAAFIEQVATLVGAVSADSIAAQVPRSRLVALLLLTPAAPHAPAGRPVAGPPSASPGTAVPR